MLLTLTEGAKPSQHHLPIRRRGRRVERDSDIRIMIIGMGCFITIQRQRRTMNDEGCDGVCIFLL